MQRVKEAGRELMETCVRAGGSITGEHGVGFDKRELLPLIFSEADMDTMLRVRAAFDPAGLCESRQDYSDAARLRRSDSAVPKVQRSKSGVLRQMFCQNRDALATGIAASSKVPKSKDQSPV